MKAEVARLLRGVIRLIEDDVRELADCMVEIDERESHHAHAFDARLSRLEAFASLRVGVLPELDHDSYSRRVDPTDSKPS